MSYELKLSINSIFNKTVIDIKKGKKLNSSKRLFYLNID